MSKLDVLFKTLPNYYKSDIISSFLSKYNASNEQKEVLKDLTAYFNILPNRSTFSYASPDATLYLIENGYLPAKSIVYKRSLDYHLKNDEHLTFESKLTKLLNSNPTAKESFLYLTPNNISKFYNLTSFYHKFNPSAPKSITIKNYTNLINDALYSYSRNINDITITHLFKLYQLYKNLHTEENSKIIFAHIINYVFITKLRANVSAYNTSELINHLKSTTKLKTKDFSTLDTKIKEFIELLLKNSNYNIDFSSIITKIMHRYNANSLISLITDLNKLKLINLSHAISYILEDISDYTTNNTYNLILQLLDLPFIPEPDNSKSINNAIKICTAVKDNNLLAKMVQKGYYLSKKAQDYLLKDSFHTLARYKLMSEESKTKN